MTPQSTTPRTGAPAQSNGRHSPEAARNALRALITSGDEPTTLVVDSEANLLGYYAGFVSRLLAMIIDIVLISVTVVSVTWFLSVTTGALQIRTILGFSINKIPGATQFLDVLFGPASVTFFTTLFVVAYHLFFLVLIGQTPGKALMGLRVVAVDGSRISPWRGVLRIVCYLLSALPFYLGFLWILVDDRRQAWHDKIAGTYVVYTWEARPDERFLAHEIRILTPGEEAEGTPPPQTGVVHRWAKRIRLPKRDRDG